MHKKLQLIDASGDTPHTREEERSLINTKNKILFSVPTENFSYICRSYLLLFNSEYYIIKFFNVIMNLSFSNIIDLHGKIIQKLLHHSVQYFDDFYGNNNIHCYWKFHTTFVFSSLSFVAIEKLGLSN